MKKTITIVIVVLVVLGVAWYLFKISPQTATQDSQSATTAYNSLVQTSSSDSYTTPPAFDPSTDHYQGSPTAKNVFIEYGDMQCPACAAYDDIMNQIATTFPDTVFVFRYFPLVQIHQNSVEGALANEAAGAQGKYWQMHDLLFKNQGDWQSLSDPLTTFEQYAQQVGVSDISKFTSDITNKTYLAAIQKDNNEAYALNLQGTPTFFFNGHQLQNQDLNGLLSEAQPYINK